VAGAAGVADAGGQAGGDDPGDFGGGAVAAGADQRAGGGGEFGPGAGVVEELSADELAQGVNPLSCREGPTGWKPERTGPTASQRRSPGRETVPLRVIVCDTAIRRDGPCRSGFSRYQDSLKLSDTWVAVRNAALLA
jgi:hypothetical protein